ncbi:DUF4041 domain-containing protein (plasmid) [Pontibacillus sp. ALD_SL1]|uniref:DUF4041 domain-containing protein n=1 Tax=Pontibacillus sp. ALD_SL1 TaxID=2777185 RepID=UPI001A978CA0|nr:DUF4041 domain-containing protein [Pontibacillus sp. ALD_SL1]QST02247.1 DUF4041 domain-containing protein [Pontibacillus sp. ALD_SL1]
MKKPWYLSTWFISLNFALSFLYVPIVSGIILLILEQRRQKRIDQTIEEAGLDEPVRLQEKVTELERSIERLSAQEEQQKKKTEKLNEEWRKKKEKMDEEISQKKGELIVLDDELLFQSYGFYDPKYDLESSTQYKVRLDTIRQRQKSMVKDNGATHYPTNFTLDGDKKKGQALVNNIIKMTVRSFNNECDSTIQKVKHSNIEASEKRIRKSFEQLNKYNKYNNVSLKQSYLDLKLEELYLAYEYARQVEAEKEEQRQIKEQMREEAKVQKEIAKQREKLEKDEAHFQKALKQAESRLATANDELRRELEAKMAEYQAKLDSLKEEKEQVDYREQNAKAGYVYIISNIGSFGEGVYKIGMTRRLEPMDRVKELGDASVPFTFDVHGMIFSNDAPALENALHHAFDDKRLNKMNNRKEFFRVSLDAIEQEVKKNHDRTLELTKLAEAEEYRQSIARKQESAAS